MSTHFDHHELTRPGQTVMAQYTWPLTGGVTAQVAFSGNAPTPKEIDMLVQYLKLAKSALANGPSDATTPDPWDTDDNDR